jgi:predicted transcriptional regulator
MDNPTPMSDESLFKLTADIVSAHVANNSVAIADVAALIGNVREALAALSTTSRPIVPKAVPAVPVRASIRPDFLICLEDGRKLTMLKRYLMTNHQLTPAQYRNKWQLPSDYPMVAPNYAAKRRALALQIGLGRKKETATASKTVLRAAPKAGRPRLKPRF